MHVKRIIQEKGSRGELLPALDKVIGRHLFKSEIKNQNTGLQL